MDDGYHRDWTWADAEHAAQQEHGCQGCEDVEACRATGACIKHLDVEGEEL